MPPHGMAVTGTDCTQMPGIGRTFSGYLSMITSSIRVACRNSQFRGTHKFLRVHHVFEETLLLAVCAGQSQRHARRPGWHSLVTVSPTRTNAHAHPSLRSLPSGHGEFNIIDTSLTSHWRRKKEVYSYFQPGHVCACCTSDCAICHTRNEECGVNCDGRYSCYRQRYWLAQTCAFAVLVPLISGAKLPNQRPVAQGVSVRWQRSWHGWTSELSSTASIGRHSSRSSSLTLSKGRRTQATCPRMNQSRLGSVDAVGRARVRVKQLPATRWGPQRVWGLFAHPPHSTNLLTVYRCACSTSIIFRTWLRKNHVRGIAQCLIVQTEYALTWCGSDPVICSAGSQDYLHARTSLKAPSWRPLVQWERCAREKSGPAPGWDIVSLSGKPGVERQNLRLVRASRKSIWRTQSITHVTMFLRIASFYTLGSQRIPVGWGRRMRGVQEEVAQVSCLCRRQDVSREKKSFSLTMGIPSAFLMGVSAICVRQRRQFRVRNDLVQCDVDTVQYSLFHFGVNKFISGVNSYNLSVIVQPGCEANHTCEQDNLVWSTFYGINHTVLVWSHKYRINIPCWCDKKVCDELNNIWCEQNVYSVIRILMVWSIIWNLITPSCTQKILPFGVIKHQMVWSDKIVEIKYVHTINGVMETFFGVIKI